ncbi:hypothetical protein Pfo_013486 [Paulownia fortunei]|nr:hypothetical protein Pfo_013486 [Paulownia fortunei]
MKEMDHKYSSEFLASQQLKKMIPQLILSVSIFSFVFSYSSLCSSSSSSLVYSPKFHYFSANSFPFLSQALNKNCLFLICNGLLVFLAKTSGFVRPPSGSELNDMLQKRIGLEAKEPLLENYVLEEESGEAKVEEEEEEEEEKSESPKEVSIFIAESEEEGGACDLEVVGKEERESESRSCWLFDDDEEQLCGQEVEEGEEEVDEKEELSTEELNQKFEDFIRRMKEEIMISEARQKVVMVK